MPLTLQRPLAFQPNMQNARYPQDYYYDDDDDEGSPELSPQPHSYSQPQQMRQLQLGGVGIPAVASNKENSMDDGLLSPRRLAQQVDAFGAMCSAGAGWGQAFVHALQGHKMTEEQAALCIQAHWRRHEAVVNNMAKELAAEHIQRIFRERMWLREGAAAAMQAAMRGAMERRQTDEMLIEARAATTINMAWRGHLARMHVRSLRAARANKGIGGVVRRSLSFGKKSRASARRGGGAAAAPAAASPSLAAIPPPRSSGGGGGGGGGSVLKKVVRSMSFDRKKSSSSSSGSGGKPAQAPLVASTRRTFVLERGPNGLGLELDATNTIVNVKPGGRAERQGLVMVDDTVLTIDGKSTAGKLMQDVMVPGRPVYVVEISRPERGASPPAKPMGVVRRSMSFDRKGGGGIKRSMSFDRKKW